MKRINVNPIKLFNRLTPGKTFLILGVLWLAVIALPIILYVGEARKAIHQGKFEQRTLASAQAILTIVQKTQQHLAQSANFLADAFIAKKDERKTAEEVEESIANYEDYLNKIHNTKDYAELNQITKHWHDISQHITDREVTVEHNFQSHASLVNLQLNILQHMLDSQQLTFDSDPDAHLLIATTLVSIPELTEALSQIRGAAIELLVKGNADFAGRAQLKALVLIAADKFKQLDDDIAKATIVDKKLQRDLLEHYGSTQEQYQKMLSMTQEKILSKENFNDKPEDFYRASTETIDSYFIYNKYALAQLDALLLKRIEYQQNHLYIILLGIFGLIFLVVFLSYRLIRKLLLTPISDTSLN